MKYVVLEECSKETFEHIKEAYDRFSPHAVFEARYSPKIQIAVFGFWDESYVVDSLKKFIRQIPKNEKLVTSVAKALVL